MMENGSFSEKNIGSVTSPDLIKCLKQIKLQKLLLTCAPVYELPSSISPMLSTKGSRRKTEKQVEILETQRDVKRIRYVQNTASVFDKTKKLYNFAL